MLSDGHTVFTAGLSSTVAGVTSFRHEDALGSLRFLTDGGQNVLGSSVFEAFGAAVGATGSTAGASFGWVGGADCQTDVDTGLVLMGHRYYDSRIGRFLTQDPAGDGDNWYAYAGNDPVNKTDPSGLSMGLPGSFGDFSAPDQRYGGFGGGGGGLDDFFNNEDDAMQRGQDGYHAAVAAEAAQAALDAQIQATIGTTYFMFSPSYEVRQSILTPQGAAAAVEAGEDAGGVVTVGKPVNVVSNIQGQLAKEAAEAGKSVQGGLDHLTSMLQKGYINAGKGFRSVQGVKGVLEMRADSGARVYFRVIQNGYQIVGKSAKFNQDKVIGILRSIYGK